MADPNKTKIKEEQEREMKDLSVKIKKEPSEENGARSKKSAKVKPPPPSPKYDEKGIHIESGKDLCDCLFEECEGCHFPCAQCGSEKCGHKCRCNRTWMYDSVAWEGSKIVKQNKYSKKK